MSDIDPRSFGKLEAEVESLQKQLADVAADLKAVRSAMDAAGGGWRVLVAVGAVSGAITATAIKFLPFLPLR